jgi:hypothetical protein
VLTDREVDTAALVMIRGFDPKTAVAPEGSPLALSVRVQGSLFPFCEIETFPKTAVSPGATDTLVGDATVTVPGCAAMTVPASSATRRAEAIVATSRRETSGEELRGDIRNQTSMGTITRLGQRDDGTSLVRAGPTRCGYAGRTNGLSPAVHDGNAHCGA